MSDELILDQDPENFRRAAHAAVDWIADYLENIDARPVLSRDAPGALATRLPDGPTTEGRSFEELMGTFDDALMPGITHWNHPAFFAYFAITGSHAGIIGEMLSSALNVNGMLWKTSPAVTELELIVLDRLRGLLGLPEGLFGIINDTASINTFLALAAAREALGFDIRQEGMTGRTLPQFRIYCSDQAHSSVEKAALALGLGAKGVRKIPSDPAFAMDADALALAVREDREAGVVPCAVVATTGTTSTAAIDPLRRIGEIANRESMWLHVDAAYGGSATIDPRSRSMWDGVEYADSIVVNPHKWLFTPVDCSVLWTKRPEMLRETFSLIPEYLRTDSGEVINYMDYGLQLGRRFRALKLWLVLEHYGIDRLQAVIRNHIGLAKRLADELERRDDIELLAPQSLGVVVFRAVVRDDDGKVNETESERRNEALLTKMNESGRLFVSHTKLRDRYGIRVAIGNGATKWEQVSRVLEFL